MTGTREEPTNPDRVARYDALVEAERLPEMVQRIVDEFDPLKIILFGSHARGDANRWSDIDLLVVFDEPVDKRETAVKIQRVLRGFLVAKDVIVTDTDEVSRIGHLVGTVLRPALREGELIYERE
jgi:predicted nucleotidyltransferase